MPGKMLRAAIFLLLIGVTQSRPVQVQAQSLTSNYPSSLNVGWRLRIRFFEHYLENDSTPCGFGDRVRVWPYTRTPRNRQELDFTAMAVASRNQQEHVLRTRLRLLTLRNEPFPGPGIGAWWTAVRNSDPGVLVAVAMALGAVSLAAVGSQAHRASLVDPIDSLP